MFLEYEKFVPLTRNNGWNCGYKEIDIAFLQFPENTFSHYCIMTDYVVSARKYRPDNFHRVIGQSHITTTLKNAILSGQLAQAFLFCGPRGVGKTTCARILAKTINCTHRTPEGEACNQCESCNSFNRGSSFDIFELDAAGNNSVDDIRELNQQVAVPPISGKYKVYIIDEVHMLSQQAFNAFLKTLEEPPAYAKFILATTEKQKIIPTILSRCQIFDFHRIKTDDIVQYLAYVANNEQVRFEKTALHVIAQKADGGMRDALSTFDQLVNFTGGELSYAKVIDCLNILDYDYYFKMVDLLLQADMSKVLLLFDEILSKGFEGRHFINGFSQHLRDLLVCKDPATQPLVEISEDVKPRYTQQASVCHPTFLLRLLNFANTCSIEYRDSQNKRLCVELALLKMANVMNKLQGKPVVSTPTPVVFREETPQPQPVPAVVSSPTSIATEEKAESGSGPVQPVASEASERIETPKETMSSEQVVPKVAPQGTGLPKIETPLSFQHLSRSNFQKEEEKKNDLSVKVKKLDFDTFQSVWNTMLRSMELQLFSNEEENMATQDLEDAALQDESAEESEFYFPFANEMLLNALLMVQPSAGEESNHISLEFKNELQTTIFTKNYRDILQFLRKETDIPNLKLDIFLEKQDKEEIIYTAKDKYNYLVAKNPAVEYLQKALDMTIEI